MNNLFIELLDTVKEDENKDMYNYAKMEIYEMVYGTKISEDCANDWVKSMLPVGLHWTMEETTNAMQNLGYSCDKIDYFVVANMMYNDYYDLVKENEELALKLAKDWLDDEDSKEDKLYEYWKHVIKKD